MVKAASMASLTTNLVAYRPEVWPKTQSLLHDDVGRPTIRLPSTIWWTSISSDISQRRRACTSELSLCETSFRRFRRSSSESRRTWRGGRKNPGPEWSKARKRRRKMKERMKDMQGNLDEMTRAVKASAGDEDLIEGKKPKDIFAREIMAPADLSRSP